MRRVTRAVRCVPLCMTQEVFPEDDAASNVACDHDRLYLWRDVCHPRDRPPPPCRGLRRVSSVVDRPAAAGRSHWADRAIPAAVCAAHGDPCRVSRPEEAHRTLESYKSVS